MRVCRKCFGLYAPDQLTCPKDGARTESHVDVLVGHQLGPYVVRSLIGEGGMGVVYAGEHPTLGKRIALKVLRPELSLRDDIVERFVQEARAVNTIGHANIVNIYDFGRTPYGSFYFVMEFLDGRTIRQFLDDAGPMPLEQIRMVVLGVGAALSAAHAKGFIHRDIKPENIMITSRMGQEQVKLLDFGIVKLLSGEERRHQTHTGAALGTPQYMCPEQLEESHIDHRADIFALGAVTYEMLTGAVPFPGRSHAEVRQVQLTRTPAPPSVARNESHLSRAMDGAVLWALALDPANRCKRMEDFLSAFQVGYERTLVEQASPRGAGGEGARVSLGAKAVFAGTLLLAVAGGALGSYLAFRKPQGSEVRADAQTSGTAKAPPYSEAAAAAEARRRVARALTLTDDQRRKAIEHIKEGGRPVMVPELLAVVKGDKGELPEAQKQAAQALGELNASNAAEAIPAIRKLIDGILGSDLQQEVRRTQLTIALAQLKDKVGLEELRRRADDKRPKVRETALEGLGKLGDEKAKGLWDVIEKLQPHIRADRRRRAMALGHLARLGDDKAREQLDGLLAPANDWPTRIEAAEAISRSDAMKAKAALAEAIREGVPAEHQRLAAQLLAKLGDSRSKPVLVEFLRSPREEDREKSALALGHLAVADVGKLLAEVMYTDSSPDVTLAAAVALVRE